jgi:hypothetical protein
VLEHPSGGVGIEIQAKAKKSEDFRYILFGVRQAVRAGHAVVFAPGGSYIETTDGTRIPLRCTRSGWELHVTGCGGGGGEGYAFDAETGETFTQPERRSSRITSNPISMLCSRSSRFLSS